MVEISPRLCMVVVGACCLICFVFFRLNKIPRPWTHATDRERKGGDLSATAQVVVVELLYTRLLSTWPTKEDENGCKNKSTPKNRKRGKELTQSRTIPHSVWSVDSHSLLSVDVDVIVRRFQFVFRCCFWFDFLFNKRGTFYFRRQDQKGEMEWGRCDSFSWLTRTAPCLVVSVRYGNLVGRRWGRRQKFERQIFIWFG